MARDRLIAGLRAGLEALADLLFPPHCLGCGAPLAVTAHPLFCAPCAARLPWIGRPVCVCCGRPFAAGGDRLCGECLARPPAFRMARSLFRYEEPFRSGIQAFKFRDERIWLPTLAALARLSPLMADFREPDYIVPTPLHPARLRERGFNQSLLLARHCFPAWRRKIAPNLLLRTRPTTPQASLDGASRRSNLQGAFAVAPGANPAGKRVLLVDDVFTTGTTVNTCAQTLTRAGVERVEVFTPVRSIRM